MTYTLDNGRTIQIPDADIERLQKNHGISYNEAVYTWLVDEEYINDETVDKLSEKAKKNRITATIHEAKSQKNDKKERKPREKKENPLKKQIINAICDGIEANSHCFNANEIHFTVTNDEKYIDLYIDGMNFTINLVQHREKKGK